MNKLLKINADLHIHSRYSMGVSNKMTIPNIIIGAKQKGINIMGTGDITHKQWRAHIKEHLIIKDDLMYKDGIYFIPTTEIEDMDSIHHLIILPDLSAAEELENKLQPYSKNISKTWGGRPHVNLNGAELLEIVLSVDGLMGPAHAFTPFKAIFRADKYSRLKECYGELAHKISFLELGLSADTLLADRISELHKITFLSNSDAHSPTPLKLGREFNRFQIQEPSFEEIKKAILRAKGRKIILNAGFDPRLGKYYSSFCKNCKRRVKISIGDKPQRIVPEFIIYYYPNKELALNFLKRIQSRKEKCPYCNATLSLGVKDRIELIADTNEGIHPEHRPPYIWVAPLMELIRASLGLKTTTSSTVMKYYQKMISDFGDEARIIVDSSEEELMKYDKKLANLIINARKGNLHVSQGGGGIYGMVEI